jgi:hypothetical protein
MSLDSRRYLAAVELDGHLLVIGVTPDRITALANWPLEDDDLKENVPKAPPRPKFAPDIDPDLAPNVDPLPTKSQGPKRVPPRAKPQDVKVGDFTLTLDEEPFSGPQTNDDFIDLDINKKND